AMASSDSLPTRWLTSTLGGVALLALAAPAGNKTSATTNAKVLVTSRMRRMLSSSLRDKGRTRRGSAHSGMSRPAWLRLKQLSLYRQLTGRQGLQLALHQGHENLEQPPDDDRQRVRHAAAGRGDEDGDGGGPGRGQIAAKQGHLQMGAVHKLGRPV